MEQQARNVTDPVDGYLRRARHLIHDRDPLYTRVFGEILESAGVQPIRLPPKSPNLNAYAERFVRSIKEECLTRVVPLGEGHLRRLVYEYIEHYHRERNHQGLDNQLLQRPPPPRRPDADVRRPGTPRRITQFLQSRGRMRGRPIKRTLRAPCERFAPWVTPGPRITRFRLAADLGRMGLDTHRVSNKVSKITSRHLVPLDRAFPAHTFSASFISH